MKQLIDLNQNGRINLTDPSSGVAQLPCQAIDSLPNEVGYNDSITIDWHFSVVNNEFYSAENSQHKIYRTLNTPSAHYHTSVDVACNGVSGSDEILVFNAIWGKFTGLNITSADGYPMAYWGTEVPPQTLSGLVSSCNGSCIAWADFLIDVLKVHSISSTGKIIKPQNPFFYNNNVNYLAIPIGLYVNDSFDGQNNDSPPNNFNLHKIVLYNNIVYDPSYGNSAASLDLWEATCIDHYDVLIYDIQQQTIIGRDQQINPINTTECILE